ncbi:MAG: hypothetical protein PHU08_05595 [Dehalococcoidales bacterium]|nr:hypothetical protein [Dehalococcoidales bacterium]
MRYLRQELAVLLVLAVLVTCGCINSGYRSIKVEDQICSYSFEYPASYTVDGPSVEDNSDWRYSTIGVSAPRASRTMKVPDVESSEWRTYEVRYTPLGVSIFVRDSSVRPDLPRKSVDRIISLNQDNTYFKVLDNSGIIVDGNRAEQLAYEDAPFSFITPTDSKPQLKYERDVFFDYNGLNWHISMTSDIELRSEADSIFEHIVQTFKILD